MERYIVIVSQGAKKLLWIINRFFSTVLYNTAPVSTQQLSNLLSTNGIYHYRPFGKGNRAICSLFPYQHPVVRNSIWQMKFKGQINYVPIYAALLGDVLLDRLSEIHTIYHFEHPLLITVPSHSKTVRKRGYAVTDLLARALVPFVHDCEVEYLPSCIRKTKHIPRQSHITNRNQRLTNPRGAFGISKPSLVRGRNIILLDDVYTTGATLNECCHLLHQSGATKIFCITIAH